MVYHSPCWKQELPGSLILTTDSNNQMDLILVNVQQAVMTRAAMETAGVVLLHMLMSTLASATDTFIQMIIQHSIYMK